MERSVGSAGLEEEVRRSIPRQRARSLAVMCHDGTTRKVERLGRLRESGQPSNEPLAGAEYCMQEKHGRVEVGVKQAPLLVAVQLRDLVRDMHQRARMHSSRVHEVEGRNRPTQMRRANSIRGRDGGEAFSRNGVHRSGHRGVVRTVCTVIRSAPTG